jgi:hypothetical protein
MLPPAGRNWQLIYPYGRESAVNKALIAAPVPVKSYCFHFEKKITTYPWNL